MKIHAIYTEVKNYKKVPSSTSNSFRKTLGSINDLKPLMHRYEACCSLQVFPGSISGCISFVAIYRLFRITVKPYKFEWQDKYEC
jgi:hypothetical protein